MAARRVAVTPPKETVVTTKSSTIFTFEFPAGLTIGEERDVQQYGDGYAGPYDLALLVENAQAMEALEALLEKLLGAVKAAR